MTEVARLPAGRHGLTREEVHASQRGRMLDAIVAAVADLGYAATPVAEVIRRAGVSRGTFYEHFSGKEDCFLAAYDAVAGRLAETIGRTAATTDAHAGDPLSAALRAYLDGLVADPRAARVFLVESYAAGPAAVARRVEVLRRFADVVAALADVGDDPGRRFACEAFANAVSSMVTMRIATGDLDAIPALHGPLLALGRDLLRAGDTR